MYLNTISPFSYDPADKKSTSAACAKASTQLAARAVGRQSGSGEGIVLLALVEKKSSPSFFPKNSRQLRKQGSIRSARFDLGLALRIPLYRMRRPRLPRERYKIVTPVLWSRLTKEGDSSRSQDGAGRRKKSASGAETLSAVKCMRAKKKKLKHERFADSVLQSRPLWNSSSQYLGSPRSLAALKRSSKLSTTFAGQLWVSQVLFGCSCLHCFYTGRVSR